MVSGVAAPAHPRLLCLVPSPPRTLLVAIAPDVETVNSRLLTSEMTTGQCPSLEPNATGLTRNWQQLSFSLLGGYGGACNCTDAGQVLRT